jgi:hypothetical protein
MLIMDGIVSGLRSKTGAWAATLAGLVLGAFLSLSVVTLGMDSWQHSWERPMSMIVGVLSIAAATIAGYSLRAYNRADSSPLR